MMIEQKKTYYHLLKLVKYEYIYYFYLLESDKNSYMVLNAHTKLQGGSWMRTNGSDESSGGQKYGGVQKRGKVWHRRSHNRCMHDGQWPVTGGHPQNTGEHSDGT